MRPWGVRLEVFEYRPELLREQGLVGGLWAVDEHFAG